MFLRSFEKIIEQIVRIMIFYISINHSNTFIDFAQNVGGGGRPHFNKPLLNKEFPYFSNGFLFYHKGFGGDVIANSAIGQEDSYPGSKSVFSHIECASQQFLYFPLHNLRFRFLGVLLLLMQFAQKFQFLLSFILCFQTADDRIMRFFHGRVM